MSDRTEKEPETGQKEEAAVHEEKEKVQEEKEKAPVRKIGRYMPQAQMAAQMRAMGDKASVEYQRLSWIALGKSLTGLVNKVSATNIEHIVVEVFRENLVRGRGLLCRALMRAQRASPAFTPVYAALVAVVNTKVPDVGELLLVRLVDQLRKAYRRNDRAVLLATVRFLAHLLNQRVADVSLGLELCALLLERPTEDSVEVAVEFVREAGYTLQEESPRGMGVVFESFRAVLQEGRTGLRVQYTIEDLFAVRRSDFAGHQGVPDALDLVEEDDQITHDVALDAPLDVHDELNTFRPDPDFLENEAKWRAARHEILGDSDDEDEGGGGGDADDESGSGDDEDEDEDENESNNTAGTVISSESATEAARIADETAMELVNLKKTIYLTIMSSIDFEECAHKLLKMSLKPGQEGEVCRMVVECCSQERTYLRFYGLLAERFCRVSRDYQQLFEQTFLEQYAMIHRLETNKLRNVAKLFAHLFHSDAISWDVLQHVHLNEQETTSSSRIFIKILFQEIAEFMGLARLNARLNDPAKQDVFAGLFPRDTPRNTRFAINFFTSIGLGGLTDELREYLKNMPKQVPPAAAVPAVPAAADSDSSSLSSSTLSSSTSSSSSSSSSLSDSGSGSGSASSSYSSYSSSSSSGSGTGSSASSSDSDSAHEPERKKRRSRSKSRSRSRSRSHRRHR